MPTIAGEGRRAASLLLLQPHNQSGFQIDTKQTKSKSFRRNHRQRKQQAASSSSGSHTWSMPRWPGLVLDPLAHWNLCNRAKLPKNPRRAKERTREREKARAIQMPAQSQSESLAEGYFGWHNKATQKTCLLLPLQRCPWRWWCCYCCCRCYCWVSIVAADFKQTPETVAAFHFRLQFAHGIEMSGSGATTTDPSCSCGLFF